jgi:hypothetical protein
MARADTFSEMGGMKSKAQRAASFFASLPQAGERQGRGNSKTKIVPTPLFYPLERKLESAIPTKLQPPCCGQAWRG